jgi:hypothetical protein
MSPSILVSAVFGDVDDEHDNDNATEFDCVVCNKVSAEQH